MIRSGRRFRGPQKNVHKFTLREEWSKRRQSSRAAGFGRPLRQGKRMPVELPKAPSSFATKNIWNLIRRILPSYEGVRYLAGPCYSGTPEPATVACNANSAPPLHIASSRSDRKRSQTNVKYPETGRISSPQDCQQLAPEDGSGESPINHF